MAKKSHKPASGGIKIRVQNFPKEMQPSPSDIECMLARALNDARNSKPQ